MCLGLTGAACAWLLDVERRLADLLNLLGRFGFTGALIAGGLFLFYMLAHRSTKWLWS